MFGGFLRVLALATVASVSVPTVAAVEPPADGTRSAAAGSIITDWNAIAQRTIFAEAKTPIPASGLYFSYVSLAMYDAVVSIHGRYEQYVERDRDFGNASSEVAAATAATVILRHYFPDAAEELRADYRRTLAGVPRDRTFANGARAGIAAAAALIARRLGDGRDDPDVVLDVEPVPGAWRPTPPDNLPIALPWLRFVEPFTLDSGSQFRLPEPNPLGSDAYAEDFNEVKRDGDLEGANRTEAQTENALFFSVNAMVQYHEGLRDRLARSDLDIVDTARAFALLSTATADALIACAQANLEHPTWRPITAIRLAGTDGNDATEPDPDWQPLGTTPPYPEFASGHACLTGAASGTFSHLFGAETMDLNLTAAPMALPKPLVRHYDSAAELDEQAMDARVWLGVHFRSSLRSANQLGHDVADWAAANRFQPTGEDRTPGTDAPEDGGPDWQPARSSPRAVATGSSGRAAPTS